MKKLLVGLVAAFFAVGHANAGLLVSYGTDGYGGSSSGGSNDGGVFFEFGVDPTPGSTDIFGAFPSLFGDTLITADTVITITSGAGFDNFVNYATNGVDDQFFLAIARNVGGSPVQSVVGWGPESGVFGSMSSASLNGIDLAGLVITSIVLTIENFSAPASASGYSYNFDFRVDVYGDDPSQVPLPAAAPLLLMGLGGIAAMRRKRKAVAAA